MNRKITKLIEHLEVDLLEDIEEAKVDQEKAGRIKEKTMQKIREQQLAQESDRARKGSFRLGKMKKVLIIAAVLCGLIGVAVGAVSISPTLQEFFGKQLELVAPHAQNIQKSISQNGVTMTVDTAVAGNSGGLIILRVTHDDGSSFEDGSEFKDFQVNSEGGGSQSYGHGWQLSEDKKVLTYIIHLKAIQTIVGLPIEVTGTDIVRVTQHEEVMPIDLSKVKKARAQELYSNNEVIGDRGEMQLILPELGELMGIDLKHPESDVVLGSVGFEGDLFFTYMEYKKIRGGVWQLYRLIDERTGETLFYKNSHGQGGGDSQIQTEKTYYEGITPEDLSYIKIVKMYNTYETFTEGEWKLNFVLEPNKSIKSFKGKKTVELEGGTYKIEHIEVSALGGSIEGSKLKDNNQGVESKQPELHLKLHLKDGSSVMMNEVMTSSGGNGEHYNIYMEAGTPWYALTEEEKEERRKEADKNRYKRETGYDYFLEIPIIDIDQVESIQIEDTIFPLK